MHKDDQDTAVQTKDSSPVRIETIEELLRKRGFFDSAERWNREKDTEVLVS